MQTLYKYSELDGRGRVVALGNFDGIHKGHASLIKKAVLLAHDLGLSACVYAFEEHPRMLGSKNPGLITDNDEKSAIISELGADILFLDDFDTVKGLSCEQFCRDILVGKLSCEVAVCGKNHQFGKDRAGDCSVLEEEMKKLGKSTVILDHVCIGGEVINSTSARKSISDGDMDKTIELLGRPYGITAKVIHGRHLGTEIGVPTVNQLFPENKLRPANGVYACICTVDGKKYMGVANVGTKPTVTYDETDPPVLCETHIINFTDDVYGKDIRIDFYRRLRGEKKFSSLEELTAAIRENIKETQLIFKDTEGIERI